MFTKFTIKAGYLLILLGCGLVALPLFQIGMVPMMAALQLLPLAAGAAALFLLTRRARLQRDAVGGEAFTRFPSQMQRATLAFPPQHASARRSVDPTRQDRIGRSSPMATVTPFYSKLLTSPRVYHDDDRCSATFRIPANDRTAGTGELVKCGECTGLAPWIAMNSVADITNKVGKRAR